MKKLIITLWVVLMTARCGYAMTRDEIRTEYANIVEEGSEAVIYESLPDTQGFTSVGQLSEAKEENALRYVNFLRKIAGLNCVELNPLYSARAQHAACLLATNDELTHDPVCPADASIPMYQTALEGAQCSNLVKLQWSRPEILLEGVSYFARDDGADNLETLPHRRWLFDPSMQETGFGMAESQSGNVYIAMYAVDGAERESDCEYTLWPAEGLFPAELMRDGLPWSVMLNDEIYDISHSEPVMEARELTGGASFTFNLKNGTGDGSCGIDISEYGYGPCLYFLPGTSETDPLYEQNRVWHVSITGLLRRDGTDADINYECKMISLTPIEVVNVELSDTSLKMAAGESRLLEASVIPEYADDTNLIWTSSDSSVAAVDNNGLITAVSEGICNISAETCNGIIDECVVTVKA